MKKILWVDDEIGFLKPHIMFLNGKGYSVTTATNGEDAISLVRRGDFDLVLLDEMMAGRDGLSTLVEIKKINPNLPVIMITKSEEEELMNEAIGYRIDDYLTKPVNPSQILSACKRILDSRRILMGHVGRKYAADFGRMKAMLSSPMGWREWIDLFTTLMGWELEIESYDEGDLSQMHQGLRRDCNAQFGRYVETFYPRWVRGEDSPPLSVDVVRRFVAPHVKGKRKVVFVIIDCMRLDHWLAIEPLLSDFFDIKRDYYFSILPTATPFSRNAIFSGLFPEDFAKEQPDIWRSGRDDDYSLNRYEHGFLDSQFRRLGLRLNRGSKYVKVLDRREAERLPEKVKSLRSAELLSIVFNFLDTLAHGRSESEILREITPNEAAFRSLTRSWFEHSALFRALRSASEAGSVVVLTSDHGSVLGTRAATAYGDRTTSTNLRYKYGNNLNCDPKQAVLLKDPSLYRLPKFELSTTFIIAKEDYYFVYPTRFHEYQRQYQNSFQHGGISMEEMILPVATMVPK